MTRLGGDRLVRNVDVAAGGISRNPGRDSWYFGSSRYPTGAQSGVSWWEPTGLSSSHCSDKADRPELTYDGHLALCDFAEKDAQSTLASVIRRGVRRETPAA
jgi:hypothetical protein